MEHFKLTLIVGMVVVLVLGVLTRTSKAASLDPNLQALQMDRDEDLDQSSWKMLLREQLRQELMEMDNTEKMILSQIEALNEQRDKIKAQKRGHKQCFLNLVSCYRKRK